MAEPVFSEAEVTIITEDTRIEAAAWKVPESEEYPSGLKYRFQALDMEDQEIERWDNTTDSHGPKHHKHVSDEQVEPIPNPPDSPEEVKDLLREFVDEVT